MVSIVLSMASAVQSVVGFGLAMFAVPLLLWSGIDLLPAVFLVLATSFAGSIVGVARLKSSFDIRKSAFASALRILGIIPGYTLAVASQGSPTDLKAAIGFTIALGVVGQSRKFVKFGRNVSSDHLAPADQNVQPSKKAAPWAFFGSGILMGWLGMGGPPLIFWLLSGRQCPKVSRSFLYGVYMFTIPFQLALMTVHRPETALFCLPLLAVAIPCSVLAGAVGLRVGDLLNTDRLHRLSLVLLSLLACKSIVEWLQSL